MLRPFKDNSILLPFTEVLASVVEISLNLSRGSFFCAEVSDSRSIRMTEQHSLQRDTSSPRPLSSHRSLPERGFDIQELKPAQPGQIVLDAQMREV